ncbi:hypothetical protein Tco_0355741 [Tanacetum coccineum]
MLQLYPKSNKSSKTKNLRKALHVDFTLEKNDEDKFRNDIGVIGRDLRIFDDDFGSVGVAVSINWCLIESKLAWIESAIDVSGTSGEEGCLVRRIEREWDGGGEHVSLSQNDKEEILLAEAWIEHSQDNNIGKDQRDEIYWNKIIEDFHDRTTGPARTKNMLTGKWTRMHGDCQRFNAYYKQANCKSGENEADLIETVKTVYLERVDKKFQYPHVWKFLKEYLKWDAVEPIDGDNLQEVFGPDKRERPAGKQRAVKKQKSVETSGSTGGSQSESVSSLVSQDYRRKCVVAERTYEAQREKDLAIKKCEEMKFLMIDTSNLPPHKRAFIEMQQAEIIKKYENAGVDD